MLEVYLMYRFCRVALSLWRRKRIRTIPNFRTQPSCEGSVVGLRD